MADMILFLKTLLKSFNGSGNDLCFGAIDVK